MAGNPVNIIDPSGLYGKVTFQQRHISFSHTGSRDDAENIAIYPKGFPFIGLGIPVQMHYAPLSSRNPFQPGVVVSVNNRPPIDGTDRVIHDFTKAEIEYSGQAGPSGTVDPWGGKLGGDQNGHIIPRNLGGSNQQYNFFAQNKSINLGGYSKFGVETSKRLDTLYVKYKACGGPKPKLTLTVDFEHDDNEMIAGYPLRPTKVNVLGKFSDGTSVTGWFSNKVGDKSNGKGSTYNYWFT